MSEATAAIVDVKNEEVEEMSIDNDNNFDNKNTNAINSNDDSKTEKGKLTLKMIMSITQSMMRAYDLNIITLCLH